MVEQKNIPGWMTTIILLMLIAVAGMGLLTAKKHLIREPTVEPVENDINFYTELVNQNPQDPEVRLGLAYTLQKAGQLEEAKKQYENVLEVSNDNMAALYNLGVIAKDEQDYETAEKHFKKVLELNSEHVLGVVGLGEIYIAQGDYDKAIAVVDSVMDTQHRIVNIRLIKGQALEKKGDIVNARAEYEAVLKFVPNHKEAKEALERLK